MDTYGIVLKTYVDMEIRDRLVNRQWYRRQRGRAAYYADLELENTTVLRELLRIKNRARREALRQDARSSSSLAQGDFYAYAR